MHGKLQITYPATMLALTILFGEAFTMPVMSRRAAAAPDLVCSQTNPVNFPFCELPSAENYRTCYKINVQTDCNNTHCTFKEKPKNANFAPRNLLHLNRVQIISPQRNHPAAYPANIFCVYNITMQQCPNKTKIFLTDAERPNLSPGDWLKIFVTDTEIRELDTAFDDATSVLYNASSFKVYFYADGSTSRGGFNVDAECSDKPLEEDDGSGGVITPDDATV